MMLPEAISERERLGQADATSERPLGILHVVAGRLYGGVESYLATVARLAHLHPGLKHEFAVCYPGRMRDELIAAGAAVHELGGVRMSRPWTVYGARRRLSNLIASKLFDAVVMHGCWPHAIFGPAVKRTGAKLVHVMHDNVAQPGWLDRYAARSAPDLIVANSEFTAPGASRLFRDAPMEVCYYPVEASQVAPAARAEVRRELGTPDDRIVILQASRLERWKGQSALIGALGHLAREPRWECWIAGGAQRPHEAVYLAELRSAAAKLGVADRVRFLGQRSDVRRLMASADVFCQPNTGPEPFGIVFIEALYAGLPVVTSDFGGGAEILSGGKGILVPPADETRLAEALSALIVDDDRRKALGAVGPARAAQLCDPIKHLQQFERAIRRVVTHGN